MNQPKMSLKKFKKYFLDSPSKEEPVNGWRKRKEKGKGKEAKQEKKGRKSRFFNTEKTNYLLISYLHNVF